jgi:hypothetical protein
VTFTVPALSSGGTTAACREGTIAIGGGFEVSGGKLRVTESTPEGGRGWHVEAESDDLFMEGFVRVTSLCAMT